MKISALATDGDGTLLIEGRLAKSTARALERLRDANIFLLLVTGETRRELTEFPRLDLFDWIVAENGSVLFNPATNEETVLGTAPPAALVETLRKEGIKDLKIGEAMISAKVSAESAFREVMDQSVFDWEVNRNRHDIMLLPQGIDKASGLAAALAELHIPKEQVVAVGDAENDAAMLKYAGVGVAVADAVPLLMQRADLITQGGAGFGIVELTDLILSGQLKLSAV